LKTTRIAILAVAMAGAAVGLAGAASAQLTEGTYTWTMTGGTFSGVQSHWVLSTCGQDCLTIRFSTGNQTEVHRQGNAWTGPGTKDGCTYTIDNNSLAGHDDCLPGGGQWQLSKDG
jgi:hypothetical protein